MQYFLCPINVEDADFMEISTERGFSYFERQKLITGALKIPRSFSRTHYYALLFTDMVTQFLSIRAHLSAHIHHLPLCSAIVTQVIVYIRRGKFESRGKYVKVKVFVRWSILLSLKFQCIPLLVQIILTFFISNRKLFMHKEGML